MREIPLTKGKVALVDDEDHEWLSAWKWQALVVKTKRYAFRTYKQEGRTRTVYMHRAIAADIRGEVDHVDGDGLNNQRANLRPASDSQQRQNARRRSDNTSGFKGVTRRSGVRPWSARIKRDGICRHLGAFTTPEEAARAYDRAALELFGEFARLNFPEGIDKQWQAAS